MIDRKKLAQLWALKYPVPEMARVLECSERTVQRNLKRLGWREGRTEDSFILSYSPSLLEKAEEMLKDGMSYPEAGRTLNVSDKQMRRLLPGYTWTKAQSAAHARLVAQLNALPDTLP